MATDIPNNGNEVIEVKQMMPVPLTGVRDPGMRALVLLAASLGWNVIQKINSPIVLVARDGTQRRLPTNTSVRMSVFQSALSTIMAHTYDRDPQPELIDKIVAEAKVDRDHERRLRLAIGETAEEHKQRLANTKAAEQKREPDEHLTYHPVLTDDEIEEPEPTIVLHEERVSFEPPYDGNKHGGLMSRQPFVAHHSTSTAGAGRYVSDSSFERVWQDGYKDYECVTCGLIRQSAKSIGAHRQVHYKSGEVPRPTVHAHARAERLGVDPEWVPGSRRTSREVAEQKPPYVDDLVFEDPPEPDIEDVVADATIDLSVAAVDLIAQIAALVAPQIIADRDHWRQAAANHELEVKKLQAELEKATAYLTKLRADWDALRGLIDGR